MKLLIFSDIHNDWKALERLLATDADYYIAAGDQITWGKGLERCGEILGKRADKMYVLPGNHESAGHGRGDVRADGLHDLHEQPHSRWGGGRSPVWATPARRRSTRPANTAKRSSPTAWSRSRDFKPLVLMCHAPPYGTRARPDPSGAARRIPVRARIHRPHQPAYFFCGHIHEAEGVAIEMGKTRAMNVGKKGFVRIGLNPHDLEELEREYQPLRQQALAVRSYL